MHFLVSNCGIGELLKIPTVLVSLEDEVEDIYKALACANNTYSNAASKDDEVKKLGKGEK